MSGPKTNLGFGLFKENPKLLSPGSPILMSPGRQPLMSIQKSRLSNQLGKDMVKVKKIGDSNGKSPSSPKCSLSQIQKVSFKQKKIDENFENVKNKRKELLLLKEKTFGELGVQTETENADLNLVTGDVTPPEYYQLLAESHRQALDEALTENKELWEENEKLGEKIEKLELENGILIQLVGVDAVEEFYKSVNEPDSHNSSSSVSEDEMKTSSEFMNSSTE